MGSGSVSFCGMNWNDVLADYEGNLCVHVCVCVCVCVVCIGRTVQNRLC